MEETVHYRRSTQYQKAPCGTDIVPKETKITGRFMSVTCPTCLRRIRTQRQLELERLEDRLRELGHY